VGDTPILTIRDVLERIPRVVPVRVELPRWSFVKRDTSGRVDVISPLPCPYNYGSVPGFVGGDGDPLDALVLAERLPAGLVQPWALRGIVDFRDAGASDLKLVFGPPLSERDKRGIVRFFRAYTLLKRALGVREVGLAGTHWLDWPSDADPFSAPGASTGGAA